MSASPIGQSEEATENFANSASPQLKRFVELSEITVPAALDALNRELALKWEPITFFRGVENDLAELCIIKR